MTNELKCPKCGSTNIEEYDCYDTIHGEEETFKELYCGNCVNCGADLQWVKVYKFVGYEDIEIGRID